MRYARKSACIFLTHPWRSTLGAAKGTIKSWDTQEIKPRITRITRMNGKTNGYLTWLIHIECQNHFCHFFGLFCDKCVFRTFNFRAYLPAKSHAPANIAKNRTNSQSAYNQSVRRFPRRISSTKTEKPTTKHGVKDLLLPPNRPAFTQQ